MFINALTAVSAGRLVPAPGGVLIKDAAGEIVGGVGVSGDTSDRDEICGVAGIEGAGLTASFVEGETIWTESSYKHTPEGLVAMGKRAGLACRQQWTDDGFATTLFVVE